MLIGASKWTLGNVIARTTQLSSNFTILCALLTRDFLPGCVFSPIVTSVSVDHKGNLILWSYD